MHVCMLKKEEKREGIKKKEKNAKFGFPLMVRKPVAKEGNVFKYYYCWGT